MMPDFAILTEQPGGFVQRRNFLRSIVGALVASLAGLRAAPARAAGALRFDHGVASGDPLSDGIILWTRVSGAGGGSLPVRWLLASDPDLKQVVRHGIAWTDDWSDYTVKADVRGLAPGTTFFYRFEVDGARSPVGRTRTLPAGAVASARFAVVSCSNHPAGYFNVYRDIALHDDLDAVIHLGDYIYEYGVGEYATEHAERLGRIPEPAGEVTTLDDYRQRHAQYKADADSIAMHARHPLIAVWDDHEIANDAWRGGAQNHQDDEGRWAERRDAALRAWFEWMPVRGVPDGADTRIFRRFRYGDLMSLIMLDTRLYGRDRQPDAGDAVTAETVGAALADPERRLLGHRQEGWLRRTLAADADTTWQVIGQQVMLAPLRAPELGPLLDLERPSMLPREQLDHYVALSEGNPPMVLDTWNGYPHAREAFLADLQEYARNPVVLSGDLHTSMANDVHRHGAAQPVTVEIMPPAVSSPGFDEYLPLREPGALSAATMRVNPAVRFMDTRHRGWVRLTVTNDECAAEWHLVDTVHSRDYSTAVAARFSVAAGQVAEGLRDTRGG
jgi:alkaline phosphatase D